MKDKKPHLDQKATMKVIDDLIRAQFIKHSIVKDRKVKGTVAIHIAWTSKGADMIANYAEALISIRKATKREVNLFNALLVTQAIAYLRETGRLK